MKKLTEKKNSIKRMIDKAGKVVAGAAFATVLCTTNVYASGADVVTAPLNNLKNLVIAIIGAVGVMRSCKKRNGICTELSAAGFQ